MSTYVCGTHHIRSATFESGDQKILNFEGMVMETLCQIIIPKLTFTKHFLYFGHCYVILYIQYNQFLYHICEEGLLAPTCI